MENMLFEQDGALAASDETEGKYLTFFTDGQLFGVPIAEVLQIVGMQQITEIPEYPIYAKGIINLRGTVIPVIDMRLRFGKSEAVYDDRTCIIVTNIQGRQFGFIVDEVDEVTVIEDENISQTPQLTGGVSGRYLTGVGRLGERIVLLLNVARILGDDEYDKLADAAG